MRVLTAAAVMSLYLTSATTAQSTDCAEGTKYDDGSFEQAAGFQSFALPLVAETQKFTGPFTFSKLKSVCVCWTRNFNNNDAQIFFDVSVWAADGTGGKPGTLLGKLETQIATGVPAFPTCKFYRYDLASLNLAFSGSVYIGPAWDPGDDEEFFVGYDNSAGTSKQAAYSGSFLYVDPPSTLLGVTGVFPDFRAFGIRAVFEEGTPPPPPPPPEDPDPPAVAPLLSSQYPNFRFWVRISDSRIGTTVAGCLPETVCVAGAIPTRAEVFVRIVGPKSNGYLWPNLVKFNTTKTEVWIQQISTGETQYYLLPALATDSETLPGIVDKTGFLP